MRQRCTERGSALVEFALALTIMVPLLLGAFQFGFAFLQYQRLEVLVYNGARIGAVLPYQSVTTTPDAAFAAAVQNTVIYGDPNGGDLPLIAGLDSHHVTVRMLQDSACKPTTIEVAITNFPVRTVVADWTLNRPTVRFPYTGNWQPGALVCRGRNGNGARDDHGQQ